MEPNIKNTDNKGMQRNARESPGSVTPGEGRGLWPLHGNGHVTAGNGQITTGNGKRVH